MQGGHFKNCCNYKVIASFPGICHFFFNSNIHNWMNNAKQTLISKIPLVQLMTLNIVAYVKSLEMMLCQ